ARHSPWQGDALPLSYTRKRHTYKYVRIIAGCQGVAINFEGTGDRGQGTGDREQVTGNRGQGTGNR
ncbi:hypothetical protein, partial [Chlorogloeopsis fritschii]|uniref:hypothetical protein n=1 Tax=Chlorogloeopsis fritschii TaxID=1124 RepID=UPI0023F095E5